jgi:hypothetical protein
MQPNVRSTSGAILNDLSWVTANRMQRRDRYPRDSQMDFLFFDVTVLRMHAFKALATP